MRRIHRISSPRDLGRELSEQSTEDYWRGRQRSESRRYKILKFRHNLSSFAVGVRENLRFLRDALPPLLKALILGGVLIGLVLLIERGIANFTTVPLIPLDNSTVLDRAFPTLAVQVLATLLGIYLASVGIVLGTSYHNVSADIRELILGTARARLYLSSIGLAIGGGLSLVFLHTIGFSYGYLSLSAYVILLCFSGWAFWILSSSVFNLFNPISLSREPIRMLHKAINRIKTERETGNETTLAIESKEADRSLRILSELIELTSERTSIDKPQLAYTVEMLLILLRHYASRKHLLAPTSTWFPQVAVYPKWVETDWSEISIALRTSSPVQPRPDPDVYWLEKRSAELASTAIEACVIADDRDSALRIIQAVSDTTRALARLSRFDDAVVFAGIVRDRCRSIELDNDAALAIAMGPPLFLSNLLLGWGDAIRSWDDEIRRVVNSTELDNPNTSVVRIRGTSRVWNAAQRLLGQVQDEQAIQGRPATPDWYLQSKLAGECILSLREFADQLPKLLTDYVKESTSEQASAEVKTLSATQCLQTLEKAEQVVRELPNVVERMKSLHLDEAQPTDEFDGLGDQIIRQRSAVIERLADVIPELRPESSKSRPDFFGEALYRLIHFTEEAIREGDEPLVGSVFPSVLAAGIAFEGYAVATYKPPTYQFNAAILDPLIDLLELSGLAIIYETIRGDCSAEPVRKAWDAYFRRVPKPADAAKFFLHVAEGGFSFGISQRAIARTEWESSLSKKIIELGLARPEYYATFNVPPPKWDAPTLIKILGVSRSWHSIHVKPHTIFAAKVIAPISGESEKELMARRTLRNYYEELDRYSES